MPGKKAVQNSEAAYEKRIVRSLRQLTRKLDAHARQLLNGYAITMPQILCLDELNERGVLTVTALANAIHLSASTTGGILDRLEKKDFVTRTRDTVDRRTVFIAITDKGREFIVKTPHLLHNKLQGNLRKLAEPDKIRVADALDLLLRLMERRIS